MLDIHLLNPNIHLIHSYLWVERNPSAPSVLYDLLTNDINEGNEGVQWSAYRSWSALVVARIRAI
jgi:hypothetical protein